jgi:hypothetical protein
MPIGIFGSTKLLECQTQVVMHLVIVGICSKQALELLSRLFQAPLPGEHHAQIQSGTQKIGANPQRLAILRLGFPQASHL